MESESASLLDRPYAAAILGVILAETITSVFVGVAEFASPDLTNGAVILGGLVVLALFRFAFRRNYSGSFTLTHAFERQVVVCVLVFIVIDLATFVFHAIADGWHPPTLEGFVVALSAGISEEVTFRVVPIALMMRVFSRNGNRTGAFAGLAITAVIFSLVHASNILSGADGAATLLQMANTLCSGLFLGAVYLRTGSIILSMFAHFLHDFIAAMLMADQSLLQTAAVTGIDVVETVVSCVVLLVLAFVMVKGHSDDILAVWRGVWKQD